MKKAAIAVAALVAAGAGTFAAMALAATGSAGVSGTGVALQCGSQYTLNLALQSGTTTVPQFSNTYTTPACTATQTVTSPGTTITQTVTQTVTSPATTTQTTPPPVTTTSTGTTTTAPSSTPQPNGPTGNWALAFDDEFNSTTLNTAAWVYHSGQQNSVTDSPSNVTETGGDLILATKSASSGGQIESNFQVQVGDYAEASIQLSNLDDWDAWWISGNPWPAAGEGDILEVLNGKASTNYHYTGCSSSCQDGPLYPAGSWAGAFHTYGVYRTSTADLIYWDGKLVETLKTKDNGSGENLLFTSGTGRTFPGSMKVDYVRVWALS